MPVSAHLHFKGDCREAWRFGAEVPGGRMRVNGARPLEAVSGSGRRSAA